MVKNNSYADIASQIFFPKAAKKSCSTSSKSFTFDVRSTAFFPAN